MADETETEGAGGSTAPAPETKGANGPAGPTSAKGKTPKLSPKQTLLDSGSIYTAH
ncbi:hypothetical protein [Mesorhizobium sp. M7A.F.Ca.CA.004.02.1.1]|uniref:hypothetical protein n=1 Tax=Mesorhizobium sp. M7A.F.Ca.CA.004.02.1.1 TaxID=2496690 RepID=UPI0013DEC54F|nr:hypothetical protein [Mesorhizobium sp. M7A.F.Ca.CA.004.02.1.1]